MRRYIQPEILDELSVDDPRAIQSRRDLQKVNTFMGHTGTVMRALRAAATPPRTRCRARHRRRHVPAANRQTARTQAGMRAMLVDRRPSVSAATREGFKAAGWEIEICESDVFEWLCRPRAETADVTIANLFLHHFREGELAHLLNLTAQQTKRFIACEPRRSRTALAGASLLPADRLQRRHPARRRRQRAGGIPRSRADGVLAARRRLAGDRKATGSFLACVLRRAGRSPYSRCSTFTRIPDFGVSVNPGCISGCDDSSTNRKRQRCAMTASRRTPSIHANASPMHPRDPPPNGKYENRGRPLWPVHAPPVGIEPFRFRKVARVPMNHPGAHHDQRSRVNDVAPGFVIFDGNTGEQPGRRIQPHRFGEHHPGKRKSGHICGRWKAASSQGRRQSRRACELHRGRDGPGDTTSTRARLRWFRGSPAAA